MKKLFAIALLASFTTLAAPLQWTCDWPEAKSQTFSLYQGETATFEPTFRVNGRTVTNATIEAVWYQTNGMGNAWWKLYGATFAPSNDVGAAAYRFFVEASVPGSPFPVPQTIYRANGALRMLPSPGFTPNAIEPPIVTLDFANIEVANAPYYNKAETEAKIVELAPAPDYSTNNAELVETIHQTEVDPTVPAWAKKTVGDFYSDNLYMFVNRDFYANDSSIKSQYSIWLKGDSKPTVTVGRDKISDNTYPYTRQTVLGFSAYEGFDYYAHYRPRGIYIWPWWNEDAANYIAYLFPTNGNGGTFALTKDIPSAAIESNRVNIASHSTAIAELTASISTLDDNKADRSELGGYATPEDVTAAIREQSLGGIWDETLQVWWTPRMRNGSLTYEATTNVNLNAEN